MEWLREFPSTMWDVISRPAGIAVIEIMLPSRGARCMCEGLCTTVMRSLRMKAGSGRPSLRQLKWVCFT
jgi:hypothetical protein